MVILRGIVVGVLRGAGKLIGYLVCLGVGLMGVVWEFSDGVPWVSGSKVAWNLGRWSC